MGIEFLAFAAIGFVAQIIDGVLGMAYGVSATTALFSMGVSSAAFLPHTCVSASSQGN